MTYINSVKSCIVFVPQTCTIIKAGSRIHDGDNFYKFSAPHNHSLNPSSKFCRADISAQAVAICTILGHTNHDQKSWAFSEKEETETLQQANKFAV